MTARISMRKNTIFSSRLRKKRFKQNLMLGFRSFQIEKLCQNSSYIAQPVGKGFPYWEIWDLQMGILGLFYRVEGLWCYEVKCTRLALEDVTVINCEGTGK